MSLIIEIAGMLGGMLAEHAESKKWKKRTMFFAASGVFFTLFSAYVLLFPSERGIFVGILTATFLGLTLGLCTIGIMFIDEKKK